MLNYDEKEQLLVFDNIFRINYVSLNLSLKAYEWICTPSYL